MPINTAVALQIHKERQPKKIEVTDIRYPGGSERNYDSYYVLTICEFDAMVSQAVGNPVNSLDVLLPDATDPKRLLETLRSLVVGEDRAMLDKADLDKNGLNADTRIYIPFDAIRRAVLHPDTRKAAALNAKGVVK